MRLLCLLKLISKLTTFETSEIAHEVIGVGCSDTAEYTQVPQISQRSAEKGNISHFGKCEFILEIKFTEPDAKVKHCFYMK